METCVICGRPMYPHTLPYWIIDPLSLEVKGKAHKTCRNRLKTTNYQFTVSAEGEAPSKEVIAFSKKMIDAKNALPPWQTNKDFKVIMLLFNTFRVSSVDALFALPDVVKQFAWWRRPEGHWYTEEDIDEIKSRVRELLK